MNSFFDPWVSKNQMDFPGLGYPKYKNQSNNKLAVLPRWLMRNNIILLDVKHRPLLALYLPRSQVSWMIL